MENLCHQLQIFCICADDTKNCKHKIYLLLFSDTDDALQFIICQVEGFDEIGIYLLQITKGRFLPFLGNFRSFLVRFM